MLFDALGFPLSRRESRRIVLAPPAYCRQLGNVRRAAFLGGKKAPAAPTGLTATPATTSVVLSWTAAAGATTYNVYRGYSSGGESATALATGISGTTYTDSSLAGTGPQVFYTVKAVNSGGTSLASSEVTTFDVTFFASFLDAGWSPLFQLSNGTTPVTTNGQSVGYWTDLSGNVTTPIQATAGARPTWATNAINGLPVIAFNGSAYQLLTNTIATTGGLSVFAVMNATNTDACAIASTDTSSQFRTDTTGGSGDNTLQTYDGATLASSTALGTNVSSYSLCEWVKSGTTVSFYQNGTAYGTGTFNPVSALNEVGGTDSGSFPMTGNIAILLVVPSAVSTAQRQAIESLINTRYGV